MAVDLKVDPRMIPFFTPLTPTEHSQCMAVYIAQINHNRVDSKMGARPLARKIDELIRVPLSKKIVFENVKNSNVFAILNGDEIEFTVTQKVTAFVGYDGVITVE